MYVLTMPSQRMHDSSSVDSAESNQIRKAFNHVGIKHNEREAMKEKRRLHCCLCILSHRHRYAEAKTSKGIEEVRTLKDFPISESGAALCHRASDRAQYES